MSNVVASIRIRRFISAVLFLSFLVAVLSGVALYFRPEGSLARWAGWSMLGLDKKHWEAVHIVFVLMALLAALAHVILNWKPLLASLFPPVPRTPDGRSRLPLRVEGVAAAALVILAFATTVVDVQPTSGLVAVRTAVKDGRYAVSVPPPVADADKLSVAALCRTTGLDEARAIANASAQGIVIRDAGQTLAAVARKHGLSPEAVFAAMRGR